MPEIATCPPDCCPPDSYDDEDEAVRAYVSRLWAADWDSPEDAAYDEDERPR